MATTADKLQKLIDGKQYVIDKTNAKAGTDLKINSTWQSIGDIIEELETTPSLQEKTTTPNKTPQTIIPDEGYDGLSKVFVNPIPDNYIEPNGTINITSNGTHDVFGYKNANVNVPSEASRIITQSGWQGTQVPNSGYVEKVYFNTNLSVEETVSLLNSLNLVEVDGDTGYILLNDESGTGSTIVAMPMDGVWGIGDFTNEVIFFASSDMGMGFVGWNPDISYPYSINSNVSNILLGASVGAENNLLTSLFSTTPFVQGEGEVITLSGDYDGSSVKVTDLSAKEGTWKGIQVPNTGYVETIYFNDNLEPKEILNLFSQLTYIETPFISDPIYPILFSSDGSQVLFILKGQNSDGDIYYEIYDNNIADSSTAKRLLYLYTKDLTLEIDYPVYGILQSVINEYNGLAIGTQNDILSSFIATSTFGLDQSKRNILDVKQYIDKGKLPLKFSIDIPQMLGIQLTPTSRDGQAFTYKFDGIYTGGSLANYENQYTYNEELTKMVKEFSSYLDINLETQTIMGSSFYRYKNYDISTELEFDEGGIIVGSYNAGTIINSYYTTLYMPVELCKIIRSGKYPCVRAKFTLITKPINNTAIMYAKPANRLSALHPTGNYIPMEVVSSSVGKDKDTFYTQILYTE